MNAFLVTCDTCRVHGTNRPLTVTELCRDCAESTAAAHRQLGHTVHIIDEPEPVSRRDGRTQRLTTRRGW